MRALLVYPAFPPTYWGFQHSLELLGKGATLPPLGLITVAALLPDGWDLRLVDMNVAPLTDADLLWADVVLTGGMLVQEPSVHEVLARARRAGRRTVVGGPAATTSPDRFPDADVVWCGETEGRAELLAQVLTGRDRRRLVDAPTVRPSLDLAPVPRFDLLAIERYRSMSIQTSRGCPFTCEFCDIIEVFGRVPRVKSPAQVLTELDVLRRLGYRGEVFVVDDNFIGNKRAVKPLLGQIARWQRRVGAPFTFYTEASLNLAMDRALVLSMRDAGFTSVFIGIETDDPAALVETGKKQNIGIDVRSAVEMLTGAGIEVMAGFIVGFDGDTPASFARIRRLLGDLPLPLAMTGLLSALPGTALWRRLESEGRLRAHADGETFARPNFVPVMPERTLIEGYASLLGQLYGEEAWFRRSAALVDRIAPPAHRTKLLADDVTTAIRAIYRLGLRGPRRGHFWRLFARGLRRGRHALRTAIACAVRGEHMIRYTKEVVLPRLARAVREADATPLLPSRRHASLPLAAPERAPRGPLSPRATTA
jgi:radical SAM superfamily enzyme YgiQ (UPF0313 family)